eukprot:CAMPEP_0119124318 /NCGR_PEP_ID=MMETSP1310-20130426/3980_1 /TAXON_ID=464262 /ORGANISM="Genus nov. species nov., Strain RCC2339" /LENGTH=456 /DNA_ID=CAMNT_0007114257 /DNA_START=195 /DNA_END=1565 /DNA_ORIENTATION=+
MAGVAKIDATLPYATAEDPNGVPIAGYNHGERRVPKFPIPQFTKYTTFMTPSQGFLNPTWVKALVVDDGINRICFVSLDLMSADGSLAFLAHTMARADGFTVPFENTIFSASHTHSGPGAFTPEFAIQITPTMDIFVPSVQRMLAEKMAQAMVEAEANLQPAAIGTGQGLLANVTHNRRADISPYLEEDSIDPNVGVLRVDDVQGNALATLWNFAIHGVCYGPDNMKFSSDIMGGACDSIEAMGGGVAIFMNADAGDISPDGWACDATDTEEFAGAPVIAAEVMTARDGAAVETGVTISTASKVEDFGQMEANWTLSRNKDCHVGGPHNACTICTVLNPDWCTLNLPGGEGWTEEVLRFTGFRLSFSDKEVGVVTVPGEPLFSLGQQIRADNQELGFKELFLSGYTNHYANYFATPEEYVIGGYEAGLTLFGINTAEKVRKQCFEVMQSISPRFHP